MDKRSEHIQGMFRLKEMWKNEMGRQGKKEDFLISESGSYTQEDLSGGRGGRKQHG